MSWGHSFMCSHRPTSSSVAAVVVDAVELVEATDAAGSAGCDSPEPQADVRTARRTTPATAARIISEFYFFRDQRTRASAIRSQDRRRLRSSARAAAARRFAGIAARRASTAKLYAKIHVRDLLPEPDVPPSRRPLELLRLTVGEQERQLDCFRHADELELRGG